jgi:hypothetical protein
MKIMGPKTPDMNDDALVEELRAAMRESDAVPDHLLEAGRAAFTWRRVDVELELLSLSYDSAIATAAPVRGPASTSDRVLVFAGDEATITLEIGERVLMGQIVPARADRIVLESSSGSADETEADESGFFLFSRPAGGPVRLTWHGVSTGVVTDWVAL